MAAKKKAADEAVRFPKNKILETKSLRKDYIILDALLIEGDEYTVEEAMAIAAEYKNREV